VSLIQEERCTPNVRRKATLLLGEILQLANHILPLQYAAQIQVGCTISVVADSRRCRDSLTALQTFPRLASAMPLCQHWGRLTVCSVITRNAARRWAISATCGFEGFAETDPPGRSTRSRSRFYAASARCSRSSCVSVCRWMTRRSRP
jgi:hypothetical protein